MSFISGIMPFFISGPPRVVSSGNIPMFIWSATNSGLFTHVPLSLGYQVGFPDPNNGMNLFISGPNVAIPTSHLNLFLNQDTYINKTLNLFLQNNAVLFSGYIPFFLPTISGTYGSVQTSGNMNLYIARTSEGIANNLPIFLQVRDQITNTLTIFTSGGGISTSESVNLFSSGLGNNYQNVNVYMNGF